MRKGGDNVHEISPTVEHLRERDINCAYHKVGHIEPVETGVQTRTVALFAPIKYSMGQPVLHLITGRKIYDYTHIQ